MFLSYIQGKAFLQDHHPVFDTILFGGFIWIGQRFFCSSNIGCFLFIVIQCVMTVTAFSYSCVFLIRKGIRNIYYFITVLFYALYPPIPQYAITMLKDSLYSWIYVFWFVLFLEIFSEDEKKHPLTYIEATIGTCVGYFIPVNAFEIFPDAGSGLSKQIVYQPEKLSTIHYYF